MTGAVLMPPYTAEAIARLEHYLREVRATLAHSPDVNPDEIEADIRDHVATELRSKPHATLADLERVLAQLGPPEVWAPVTTRPVGVTFDPWMPVRLLRSWFRGMLHSVWRGPEDWRLAYLTFLLFWVGLITAPIVIGIPMLIASYFFARAASGLAKEKNTVLGARKWLIYPPIVLVSGPLLLAVVFVPIVAAPATMSTVHETELYQQYVVTTHADNTVTLTQPPPNPHLLRFIGVTQTPDKKWVVDPAARAWHEQIMSAQRRLTSSPFPKSTWVLVPFVTLGAFLLWWTVCGLFFWAFPAWVTTVFYPLLEGYDWLHGVRIATIFGIGFGVWCGFAARVFDVMP